jgi:hypothetical protein
MERIKTLVMNLPFFWHEKNGIWQQPVLSLSDWADDLELFDAAQAEAGWACGTSAHSASRGVKSGRWCRGSIARRKF